MPMPMPMYHVSGQPRLLAPEVWGSPFDMRLCVLSATCPLNFTFLVPFNATSALWCLLHPSPFLHHHLHHLH